MGTEFVVFYLYDVNRNGVLKVQCLLCNGKSVIIVCGLAGSLQQHEPLEPALQPQRSLRTGPARETAPVATQSLELTAQVTNHTTGVLGTITNVLMFFLPCWCF